MAGLRSRIEETLGGIETPELCSEFRSISCDSSMFFFFCVWEFEEIEDLGFFVLCFGFVFCVFVVLGLILEL